MLVLKSRCSTAVVKDGKSDRQVIVSKYGYSKFQYPLTGDGGVYRGRNCVNSLQKQTSHSELWYLDTVNSEFILGSAYVMA